MSILFKHLAGVFAAVSLFAAAAPGLAQTADCRLASFGEVPISQTPGGRSVLAASLNGRPINLAFDLENAYGVVAQADADAWKAAVREGEVAFIRQGRDSLTDIATLGSLSVGTARFNGFEAFVDKADLHGADVVLGTNTLRNFLPEFDIGHNVLRLFGKTPCPDKVVYWAPEYLQLGFRKVGDRFLVDAKINGSEIHAAISPGLARSTISPEAETRLGLARPDGTAVVETLEFGGIKLHNLTVDAEELVAEKTHSGGPAANFTGRRALTPTDLKIGDDVLKHLRFVIDFEAQRISFTTS
ncbi:MAG TPA: hypothetical protein VKQ29_10375 [Aliidongia sp.]|nr:hypothetical protein [Aliidongia sp.]